MSLLCLLSQLQLYMHHTDGQNCQDSRGNKTDIIYACVCHYQITVTYYTGYKCT